VWRCSEGPTFRVGRRSATAPTPGRCAARCTESGRLQTGNGEQLEATAVCPRGHAAAEPSRQAGARRSGPPGTRKGARKPGHRGTTSGGKPSAPCRRWRSNSAPALVAGAAEVDALVSTPLRPGRSGPGSGRLLRRCAPPLGGGRDLESVRSATGRSRVLHRVASCDRASQAVRPLSERFNAASKMVPH